MAQCVKLPEALFGYIKYRSVIARAVKLCK